MGTGDSSRAVSEGDEMGSERGCAGGCAGALEPSPSESFSISTSRRFFRFGFIPFNFD